MEDLYSFADRSELKIREMWSIDAPNHGEAAILNEKSLLWGYEPVCKSARDVRNRAALPCIQLDGKNMLVACMHSSPASVPG